MADRTIQCAKYQQVLPGLDVAPFKGDLGERIYLEISAQAWNAWVKHSTMVINEFRLNPSLPDDRAKLKDAMLKFLFEDTEELPPDYVDPNQEQPADGQEPGA